MFPLSGGVVRYPHMSFGSFASYTSGWITWVAVATTAPIEVEAALQYGTKYAPFTTEHTVNGEAVHTLTGLGYGVAVVLMAVFVIVNYFGIRWFARINNALVWWKLDQPRLQADRLARRLHRDRHLRHRVLLPGLPAGHRAGR
jgi:amino acid transporter